MRMVEVDCKGMNVLHSRVVVRVGVWLRPLPPLMVVLMMFVMGVQVMMVGRTVRVRECRLIVLGPQERRHERRASAQHR